MKQAEYQSRLNEMRRKYDVISGKIFYKGTAKEVKNIKREITDAFSFRPTDVEELVKGFYYYNEDDWWPTPELIEKGKTIKPIKLPFDLDRKQLIILNRILFHPNEEILFIATGIGGSGKSTFLNIIKQIFGDVYAANLSDLSNEFNVAEAVKHRLICSDELAKGELNCTNLKMLISKQIINVNPKHQTPYTVRAQSILFFCCNKAPRIDITDSGILRRIIYYERNTKIKNPNPNLKDKVYTEEELLQFIAFAWSLESKLGSDWADEFKFETHKYLMKDNSVYICRSAKTYLDYDMEARKKGLKPFSEPVWEDIKQQFETWIEEDDKIIMKENLF